MSDAITHIGFADESHWNDGRFRSLGLLSLPVDRMDGLRTAARKLLSDSQVEEFKWKRLDGAKERFAANKLCEFAIENVCAGYLRVDVLIWDTEDSRHKIAGRDDAANLQRMYYHLFRNVIRTRWPFEGIWRLCPDEHTGLDWQTMHDCLESSSTAPELNLPLFTEKKWCMRLRREFGIEQIQQVSSHDHPLLQIADLFAGLAVFSRAKWAEYQNWLKTQSNQPELFHESASFQKLSHSSKERFPVLKNFDDLCKKRRLGVSLQERKGLWTPKPENPLNFWLYEPQHPKDKAPQKGRQ